MSRSTISMCVWRSIIILVNVALGCSSPAMKGPSGESTGNNEIEKKQEGTDKVHSEGDAIRIAESYLRERRQLYAKYKVSAIKDDNNDEWRVAITAIPETPGKHKTVVIKTSGAIMIEPGE